MTFPFTSPYVPQKPMRWWHLRRRAARLRFLERVARMEIRVSLDGHDRLSGDLESAYQTIMAVGTLDHVRGLAHAPLLKITSGCEIHDPDGQHEATITVRMPLDVRV